MEKDNESFEVVAGAADSGLIFVCDHATNAVPERYRQLGLPPCQFERHIAYDIGVEALCRKMASHFNAPLVLSKFSRLLIDPNRGEDDPTVVMRLSDGTIIPGNHPIDHSEISERIRRFHRPYHQAIDQVIESVMGQGVVPIVFSTHSFTPAWKGVARPWQVAMLWDRDPRLASFMIEGFRRDQTLTVGDNEPYVGALKNDTMYRHATSRGLPHGLVEVRQDLISDDAGVEAWASRLIELLEEANGRPDMHEIKHYGSRSDRAA